MATPRKPIEEHKPDGRPTKYKSSFNEEAFRLTLLGLYDEQLAGYFEVSVDTLNEWKKRHPKFSASIRDGKEKADGKVTKSLYKLAMGFSFDEVSFEKMDQKDILCVNGGGELDITEGDIWKKKVTKKFVPPNDRAIQFWLKNRQPERWREKTEQNVTVEVKGYKVGFDEAQPTTEPKE